jgi:hypothetical protein
VIERYGRDERYLREGRRLLTHSYVMPEGAAIWWRGGFYTVEALVEIIAEVAELVGREPYDEVAVYEPHPVVRLVIDGEIFAIIQTGRDRVVEMKHRPGWLPLVFLPGAGVEFTNADHKLLFATGGRGMSLPEVVRQEMEGALARRQEHAAQLRRTIEGREKELARFNVELEDTEAEAKAIRKFLEEGGKEDDAAKVLD